MKQFCIPIIAALALTLTACQPKNDLPQLTNQEDTLAWALGENMGLSALDASKNMGINQEMVMQAFRHTLATGQPTLSDSAMAQAINQLFSLQQKGTSMQKEQADIQNVDQAQQEYFAQLVKEHPEVKKHPSGFYYQELKAGKGRKAVFGDRVSFDYRSFLMLSGQPYDQTYGKRAPIIHVVGRPMFQGLIDGMQLMNAGSIYRFYFPYQLAFGTQGSGQIPGHTPFIYEVEIHEIL